jgi:hypothetical protein
MCVYQSQLPQYINLEFEVQESRQRNGEGHQASTTTTTYQT